MRNNWRKMNSKEVFFDYVQNNYYDFTQCL